MMGVILPPCCFPAPCHTSLGFSASNPPHPLLPWPGSSRASSPLRFRPVLPAAPRDPADRFPENRLHATYLSREQREREGEGSEPAGCASAPQPLNHHNLFGGNMITFSVF